MIYSLIDLTEREQNLREMFLKSSLIWLKHYKKKYFDPILGILIKMFFLLGFKIHTFKTYMNV